MSNLAVIVLGNRRSGKSTTWNELFGRTVRTGSKPHRLSLSKNRSLSVFLVGGSPEERKRSVDGIIGTADAKIVLCSVQYAEHGRETFRYFLESGYSLYVQWLNPGHSDNDVVLDRLGFVPYLLYQGALVSIRDGRRDPAQRVGEIADFLAGWTRN